jgi:Family of unknown function (DUF6152)
MICRMGHRNCIAVTFAAAILISGSALAHHSFQAQFDINKPLTMKGTVSKVEWVNPHVYVHIDVKDDKGVATRWEFETLGPGRMRAEGMSKQTFGVGKVVTLKGYAARDGSKNLGFLRQVTFDDGHTIEVWLGDPADLNP